MLLYIHCTCHLSWKLIVSNWEFFYPLPPHQINICAMSLNKNTEEHEIKETNFGIVIETVKKSSALGGK